LVGLVASTLAAVLIASIWLGNEADLGAFDISRVLDEPLPSLGHFD